MSKYNANVRIGNWYDELMVQEEKTKQYMRRSKTSGLKVQKVRQLFLAMLSEIPLTSSVLGVPYSQPIQIVSPEVPFTEIYKIKEKHGMALCANIYFKDVEHRVKFAVNDQVIGSALLTPCARNVWILVPDDKSKKIVKYGDSFHIQIHNSNPPLYIEAQIPSPMNPTGECGHIVPKLVDSTSILTRFKMMNVLPQLRFETEGTIVPPGQKVALVHGISCESLAVELDTWIPTYFGMECEVSVHTFKNPKNITKPDPRNFWSVILTTT